MTVWKMPPKAKIYEALTAVVDSRVRMTGSSQAEVVSSSGDKTYTVEWSEDLRRIVSNDNASYWQGYVGYPIVAVLVHLDRLEFSRETARWLSHIPWKEITAQFKRDYDKVVEHVLEEVAARGGDAHTIAREVDRLYQELEAFELERLPARRPPPKEQRQTDFDGFSEGVRRR